MELETERFLNEDLRKCRCCFRMIIDDRKSVEITQEIRNHFSWLTQIEVS